MINKKIGIIGCGNMGSAVARGIAAAGGAGSLLVSDTDSVKLKKTSARFKIETTPDNRSLIKRSDIIILAVKPQDIEIIIREIRGSVTKDKLIISILAGIATKRIEKSLKRERVRVIRAMPNMPAFIGEGITAVSAGRYAKADDIQSAKDIFQTVGDVIEVKENFMDLVTALSGSGPAYFFYLIESLVEAAVILGLDRKTAYRLVLKTALGSARLLSEYNEDPVSLRAKVTSKGGTTEAAFKVIESRHFKRTVKEAVKRAVLRAKELSRR